MKCTPDTDDPFSFEGPGTHFFQNLNVADAKSTTSYFLILTLLGITMSLSNLHENVGPKLKNTRFVIWGRSICSKNQLDWYRPQVCQLFQSFFKHIFKHNNAPLSGLYWKTEKCRSKEIRGGAFSIRHLFLGQVWGWRTNKKIELQ